jgi:hypothetical protein
MAERMTEPVDWNGHRTPTPHPRAYDWESWTDGAAWRITRGQDYSAKTISMSNMLQRHARENGLKVRLKTDRNPLDPSHVESITFQFFRP